MRETDRKLGYSQFPFKYLFLEKQTPERQMRVMVNLRDLLPTRRLSVSVSY